jgi:hypothetical protein
MSVQEYDFSTVLFWLGGSGTSRSSGRRQRSSGWRLSVRRVQLSGGARSGGIVSIVFCALSALVLPAAAELCHRRRLQSVGGHAGPAVSLVWEQDLIAAMALSLIRGCGRGKMYLYSAGVIVFAAC